MIIGRFGNTSGAPYVEGLLLLRRLNVTANISFLVDTGADRSTLMPADGARIRIDYGALRGNVPIGGMGGETRHFQEDAVLGFLEPNKQLIHFYDVSLIITRRQPDMMRMPSLLGRDVLDNWRMVSDKPRDKVTFTVASSDATIKADQN